MTITTYWAVDSGLRLILGRRWMWSVGFGQSVGQITQGWTGVSVVENLNSPVSQCMGFVASKSSVNWTIIML